MRGEMATAVLDKKEILHSFDSLPEQVSVEDVMERLFLMAKIEKGCQEADAGKTLAHAEAEKRMEKWLQ
jgi:predicted transcriptional regulator